VLGIGLGQCGIDDRTAKASKTRFDFWLRFYGRGGTKYDGYAQNFFVSGELAQVIADQSGARAFWGSRATGTAGN